MENEKKFELTSQATGLVIVDMQEEGCEGHGPGVRPVIRKIRSLLDRFREAHALSQHQEIEDVAVLARGEVKPHRLLVIDEK